MIYVLQSDMSDRVDISASGQANECVFRHEPHTLFALQEMRYTIDSGYGIAPTVWTVQWECASRELVKFGYLVDGW